MLKLKIRDGQVKTRNEQRRPLADRSQGETGGFQPQNSAMAALKPALEPPAQIASQIRLDKLDRTARNKALKRVITCCSHIGRLLKTIETQHGMKPEAFAMAVGIPGKCLLVIEILARGKDIPVDRGVLRTLGLVAQLLPEFSADDVDRLFRVRNAITAALNEGWKPSMGPTPEIKGAVGALWRSASVPRESVEARN